ncbi:uncharacterized protein LOC135471497 isoform X2 [Liolophura sinensis]|uniref:uncharacterized protein LOC135471497 isoform X2 n=1 Tax=Liolophura sinensis TaxID=3198878 RepID=UPI003158EB09
MKTSTQWDSMYMKFLELEENALQQRQLQVRKTRKTVICCTLIQLQNKDVQTRVELWTMKASCLLLVWGEHSNNVSELSSEIIRSTTDRILESEEAASLNQEGSSLSQQDLPIFPVQMGQSVSPGANSGMDVPRPYGKPTLSRKSLPLGAYSKSVSVGGSEDRLLQEKLNVIYRSERSRINNFERFIRSKPYKDYREISSIPPDELSSYLAEFFLTVKTQSGGEFSKASLVRLRTSLERYLKEHDYPCSITLSPQFTLARIAFKKKLQMLKGQTPCRLPAVGSKSTEDSSKDAVDAINTI